MVDNELNLIGCIITDNSALKNIYLDLKPEMLSNGMTRRCFTKMLMLFDEGKEINPIELSQRLIDENTTQESAVEFLKECVMNCTASYLPSLVKAIITDYKKSEIRSLTENFDFNNPDVNSEIAKVIDHVESLVTDRKENLHTMAEIVDKFQDNYFTDKEVKRVNVGFQRIDNTFGGLEGGELVVIGARPGVGKSALVTQMITNMAFNGIKVGYFNLEMSESQIFERMVSRISRIGIGRLRHAKYPLNGKNGNELDNFRKASEMLKTDKISVVSGSIKVSEVKAKCRFRDFDIVIIDYLQLIKADREFQNRANEVGMISKSLKELAMELDIPIIALSQLNRGHTDISEPDISELRESGDIEQDASIIALMWNHKDNIKGFKIAKNRQGELAKFGLRFDGQYMEFAECDLDDNASGSSADDLSFDF